MKAATFIPKRGRPSNKQVIAIDNAILATARRILLEEGFDALAMDTVASELGISKGTPYVRHPSKEALAQAVIRDAVEGWSTTSAREDHLLPVEIGPRLQQHLRKIGRKSADPEVHAYYRLWMSIQQRDPELTQIFHDVGFIRGATVIARDIEIAGDRDGIPPKDAMGTASLMLSALTGWYTLESAVRTISLSEIDATADRIAAILMQAREAW